MVAKDGITLIDAVSETFTDFFYFIFFGKSGPGRRVTIM